MYQIRLALLALLPVLWGCSTLQEGPPPEPPRDPLSLALVEMDRERFRTAELHLREAASACPGTAATVEALLLLSVLHLDPRFAGRDPETAADYAARVIWRDRVPAPQVEVARGLYLAAVELGAPPLDGEEGEEPAPDVGPRMAGLNGTSSGQSAMPPARLPVPPCPGVDGVRRTAAALPRHPGPVLARSIGLARAALDSIDAAAPTGEPAVADQSSEEERLRARVEQLEAELSRIRRLLRGGG